MINKHTKHTKNLYIFFALRILIQLLTLPIYLFSTCTVNFLFLSMWDISQTWQDFFSKQKGSWARYSDAWYRHCRKDIDLQAWKFLNEILSIDCYTEITFSLECFALRLLIYMECCCLKFIQLISSQLNLKCQMKFKFLKIVCTSTVFSDG